MCIVLLIVIAEILIVPIAVRGTAGGIVWAKSEQVGVRDQQADGVVDDSSGVYVVGFDANLPTFYYEWRLEKRNSTSGASLWDLSEQISTSGGNDVANAAAVDASGLYIVGFDSASTNGHFEWRIEKRNLTTGAFIGTFGTGGAISEHVSNACDQAAAAAIDSTGLYIAGWDQNTVGNWDEWRIEKRSLTTGAFLSAFGKTGTVVEHISLYRDDAYSMAVDASGLYLAGKDEKSPSYPEWRIEKRSLSSGSMLWAVSEDIGTGSPGNQANGVTVDQTGAYIAGSDSALGGGYAEWRTEKRILGNQTLITSVHSGSGAVTPTCPAPNGCVEDVGSSISLTAAPSSGSAFSTWTVSGASCTGGASSNPCTFKMPNSRVTASATFISQVTMTVSYSVNGGSNPTAPIFSYVQLGARKKLSLTGTPTPVNVDQSSSWSVTNPLQGSTGSERWWTIQPVSGKASAETINFAYQQQYHLTMNVNPSGGGTVNPLSGWENSSLLVNIQATANVDYAFLSWTGSGTGSFSGSNNPSTVAINGPITETANFQQTSGQLSITLVSPKNGATVTSSPVTFNVKVAGFVSGATVTVYVDGSQACTGSTSAGSFSCKAPVAKTGGSHSWYATVSKAGFTPGTSPTWTFTY